MIPVLTESRRLTGANLFWEHPSAIVDAQFEGDPQPFIAAWTEHVHKLLEAVGYSDEHLTYRCFEGGFSLLISAPIDVLYSMCELNEAAFEYSRSPERAPSKESFDSTVISLRHQFHEEHNPALLELQSAARVHEVPFLWDDDCVSLGYGKSAISWSPDQLPKAAEIDWDGIRSIPVALVTGTNGKSTTVRMSAAIMAASGKQAGLTSTDWIRIGEDILDTGDYSGTGGARSLMRHPKTDVAILETARGGLLRRGLGVEKVSAALITNVSTDHLGEYGITRVSELIEAKFIVRRALTSTAPLILNADDKGIVDFAKALDETIIWFSLDAANPLVRQHLDEGGSAAYLLDGWLELATGKQSRRIIAVKDIPATLNGAAEHNTQNALGAAALCSVLGADDTAIHDGLTSFQGDESDNPGRGNWFEKDGVRILVDFAHNKHGMLALSKMISNIRTKRRILLIGQAGDRTDKDIAEMTNAACVMQPEVILACALPGYERGRPQSEVQDVIRNCGLEAGVSFDNIIYSNSPVEAVNTALGQARSGDLFVFLALTQREEVFELIHRFINNQH